MKINIPPMFCILVRWCVLYNCCEPRYVNLGALATRELSFPLVSSFFQRNLVIFDFFVRLSVVRCHGHERSMVFCVSSSIVLSHQEW
jgi:hypothetical protein